MQLLSRQIDLPSKSFRIHYMLIYADLLSFKSLYPHNQRIPFSYEGLYEISPDIYHIQAF